MGGRGIVLAGVSVWNAISPEVAVASTRLPGTIHSDPADRMIAATARHLGSTLITADQLLLDYARPGT